MKIAITIELDKELAELFQIPVTKFSKQINDLIAMFEKADYSVEEALDLEPETKPVKSRPKKSKKKSKPQRTLKDAILMVLKNHKDGISAKDLQEQTGLTGKQITDNIFHLKKGKKVEKTKEGLFIAL